MGREVRRVPANWEHPKNWEDQCIPLANRNYRVEIFEWEDGLKKWLKGEVEEGYRPDIWGYIEYHGGRPLPEEYMPTWSDEEKTHYMMYEDTSEGTPISPAFATPEELAQWLVDNKASFFADMTATYEQWLKIARGGWAPSMVYTQATGFISGVEAAEVLKPD